MSFHCKQFLIISPDKPTKKATIKINMYNINATLFQATNKRVHSLVKSIRLSLLIN